MKKEITVTFTPEEIAEWISQNMDNDDLNIIVNELGESKNISEFDELLYFSDIFDEENTKYIYDTGLLFLYFLQQRLSNIEFPAHIRESYIDLIKDGTIRKSY